MKKISQILLFMIHASFPLMSYIITGEYSKEALFPVLISTIIFPTLVPILYKIPLIGFIVKGIMGLYTSILISFIAYLCLNMLNIQVNILLITMISLVVGFFLTSTMRRLTTKKEMYKRRRENTADDKMFLWQSAMQAATKIEHEISTLTNCYSVSTLDQLRMQKYMEQILEVKRLNPLKTKEKQMYYICNCQLPDIQQEVTAALQKYQKMHNRNTNKRTAQEKPKNNIGFFTGCNTREDIDKRYKGLVKVFHPDNVGGDHDMFIKVQNEYKEQAKCY